MRVLVIDDSSALRSILKRTLQGLGFDDVVEACNGEEGLKRLSEQVQPDVALVDWSMPVMNGVEFVRRVRENPAWSEIKIVMITAESNHANMRKALEAGADEYIMKPFTAVVVGEKLALLGFQTADLR